MRFEYRCILMNCTLPRIDSIVYMYLVRASTSFFAFRFFCLWVNAPLMHHGLGPVLSTPNHPIIASLAFAHSPRIIFPLPLYPFLPSLSLFLLDTYPCSLRVSCTHLS